MPAHYVYKDPDKSTLRQGDVLEKSAALVTHLKRYHPYYAANPDYKYFMVLTQSCDLVRRDSRICNSPYITLAAVRPLDEVLSREAAKYQIGWQREAKVIGAKAKDKLVMFLEGLFDNNKDGYFFLRADVGLGIQQDCCTFLPLAVALKTEHYDMCLAAKIAELDEPFQAKLGYLLGHMYSRVGTTEWNAHYPDEKVGKYAASVLDKSFVTFNDVQMKEGIEDLKLDGTFKTKSPTEIKEYIKQKKVVSRKQKFQERALEALCGQDHNPIDQIRGRIISALQSDAELTAAVTSLLQESGLPPDTHESLTNDIVKALHGRLQFHLSDDNFPEKYAVFEKIFKKLLQDVEIGKIMR